MQDDQDVQFQFSVQLFSKVQFCISNGLLSVVLQLFKSVQFLYCVLFIQEDHEVQFQFSVQGSYSCWISSLVSA